jgi:hypothetical protein
MNICGTGATTTSTSSSVGSGGAVTTGPGAGGAITTGPGGSGGSIIMDSGPPDSLPPPDGGPWDAGLPPEGGILPDASPPEAGMTCPGTGDACTSCVSTGCAAEWCSCYGNVECGQLLECYQACKPGDMACDQACETADPEGISAALLLSSCAATACPTECPGNTALSPCDQCLYSQCTVQMNACVANPECVAYFDCVQPCNGGAVCIAMCQAAHPMGVVDAATVDQCAGVSCATVCK